MNFDSLTVAEVKQLAAMAASFLGVSQPAPASAFTPHIGKRCIIRTYASGVFLGTVVAQDGRMVELQSARRLWTWKAADSISLSAVAVNGVAKSGNKFPPPTPYHTLLDALEIIPATPLACKTIDDTPVAVQS